MTDAYIESWQMGENDFFAKRAEKDAATLSAMGIAQGLLEEELADNENGYKAGYLSAKTTGRRSAAK